MQNYFDCHFIVFKHVQWSCFFFEQVDFCISYLYFCLFFFTGHCEEFIIRNSCCTEISLWIWGNVLLFAIFTGKVVFEQLWDICKYWELRVCYTEWRKVLNKNHVVTNSWNALIHCMVMCVLSDYNNIDSEL